MRGRRRGGRRGEWLKKSIMAQGLAGVASSVRLGEKRARGLKGCLNGLSL